MAPPRHLAEKTNKRWTDGVVGIYLLYLFSAFGTLLYFFRDNFCFMIPRNLAMPLKFASNISFMFKEAGDVPLRYAAAAKAGFGAVESAFPVGFTVDEVKKAWKSSGVRQVLLNIYPGNRLEKCN